VLDSASVVAVDVVVDAEGALREALSSLTNLAQLLRARNVGPKSIASVLPDMLAECEPLLARLEPFFTRLRERSSCADGLQHLLATRIGELSAALQHSPRRPLGAGTRLELEAVVATVLRDLGGALPLIELLTDASAPGDVDWVEALALSRSGDQSNAPGASTVEATLVSDSQTLPTRLSPRVALNIVRLAAALVHERGYPLTLRFSRAGDLASLCIDRSEAAGESVTLLLPKVVAPSGGCLETIARWSQLALERHDGKIVLNWPIPPQGGWPGNTPNS